MGKHLRVGRSPGAVQSSVDAPKLYVNALHFIRKLGEQYSIVANACNGLWPDVMTNSAVSHRMQEFASLGLYLHRRQSIQRKLHEVMPTAGIPSALDAAIADFPCHRLTLVAIGVFLIEMNLELHPVEMNESIGAANSRSICFRGNRRKLAPFGEVYLFPVSEDELLVAIPHGGRNLLRHMDRDEVAFAAFPPVVLPVLIDLFLELVFPEACIREHLVPALAECFDENHVLRSVGICQCLLDGVPILP